MFALPQGLLYPHPFGEVPIAAPKGFKKQHKWLGEEAEDRSTQARNFPTGAAAWRPKWSKLSGQHLPSPPRSQGQSYCLLS